LIIFMDITLKHVISVNPQSGHSLMNHISQGLL